MDGDSNPGGLTATTERPSRGNILSAVFPISRPIAPTALVRRICFERQALPELWQAPCQSLQGCPQSNAADFTTRTIQILETSRRLCGAGAIAANEANVSLRLDIRGRAKSSSLCEQFQRCSRWKC